VYRRNICALARATYQAYFLHAINIENGGVTIGVIKQREKIIINGVIMAKAAAYRLSVIKRSATLA